MGGKQGQGVSGWWVGGQTPGHAAPWRRMEKSSFLLNEEHSWPQNLCLIAVSGLQRLDFPSMCVGCAAHTGPAGISLVSVQALPLLLQLLGSKRQTGQER